MLIILSALTFTFAQAQQPPKPVYKESSLVIISENETITKDFFGTGEIVEIDGTVHGDVYAAGERIDITGTVNGDVLAVGGTVNISGTVTDDVRIAGGQLNITGSVGKNVTALGGNIMIDEGAVLSGSVVSAGGNVSINAPIQKNIKAAGGSVTIGNIIQGDADVLSRQLTLLPKGHVNGQLHHVEALPHKIRQEAEQAADTGALLFVLTCELIAYFIFGLFLIHLLPHFMHQSVDALRDQTLKSFLLGIVFIFVTPILAIMFLITFIGIPLGLLLLVAYGFSVFVAQILFAFAAGSFLKERFHASWHDGWSYLLGLFFYIILSSVPIIGWAFALVVTVLGFGALIIAKKDLYMSLRKKKLI